MTDADDDYGRANITWRLTGHIPALNAVVPVTAASG